MRKNSTIYRSPEEPSIFDISSLGTYVKEDTEIKITQSMHYFREGDALYYDPMTVKFQKAIANNTIASEVCGIVSEVINLNTFIIVTEGEVMVPRYQYSPDSTLYLSESIDGHLTSIQPTYVIKPLGKQIEPGKILVDIQRSFVMAERDAFVNTEELEPYTQQELDEIILNVKSI